MHPAVGKPLPADFLQHLTKLQGANGYLLECLMQWGSEIGVTLTPFGVDCSEGLIALARERMPVGQPETARFAWVDE